MFGTVCNELGRQWLTRQLVQSKQVLEELVVFVWTVNINQTTQCFHMMHQSQLKSVSYFALTTAEKRVVHTFILIRSSVGQLFSPYIPVYLPSKLQNTLSSPILW
jgi:hypothetical protein